MRTAVLVSGGGLNLQAILDAYTFGELPGCELTAVISSDPGAYALRRAAMAGVEHFVVERELFPNHMSFCNAVRAKLRDIDAELVVLAGYAYPLDMSFYRYFPNRIIAVWPSLLPAFPPAEMGDELTLQKSVLSRGVRVTGATAFFMTDKPGEGPIILQKPVGVLPGDDVRTLAQRILTQAEQPLLVQSVALACAGRLQVIGNRVEILPASPAEPQAPLA